MSACFNVTRSSPDSQTYPPFAVQVDSETSKDRDQSDWSRSFAFATRSETVPAVAGYESKCRKLQINRFGLSRCVRGGRLQRIPHAGVQITRFRCAFKVAPSGGRRSREQNRRLDFCCRFTAIRDCRRLSARWRWPIKFPGPISGLWRSAAGIDGQL